MAAKAKKDAGGKPPKPPKPLGAEEALAAVGDQERPEPERIAAAERLGALKHTAAIDRLFAIFESAETYLARAIGAALRAMDAGAKVVKGLRSPDPAVRERAAERLLRLGDPKTEAAILDGLKDPEPRVRRALIQALARIPGQKPRQAIEKALKDRDPSVRSMAAAGLGATKDAAVAPVLKAALDAETDDIARDFIERAIRTTTPAS